MSIKTILDEGIEKLMGIGGISNTISIIDFTRTSGSYDDDITQTITGSNVVSGLLFPVKSVQGSTEALLLEQGKIQTNDKLLYCGSVNISGNILIEINNDNYVVVPDGIEQWDINGSTIFNKMYIRYAVGGSLW